MTFKYHVKYHGMREMILPACLSERKLSENGRKDAWMRRPGGVRDPQRASSSMSEKFRACVLQRMSCKCGARAELPQPTD